MEAFLSAHVLALLTPILSALLGLGLFMIKKLVERVSKLEDKAYHAVTKTETRALVNDKIQPLQQQILKIDKKLDKIIDIMLDK